MIEYEERESNGKLSSEVELLRQQNTKLESEFTSFKKQILAMLSNPDQICQNQEKTE